MENETLTEAATQNNQTADVAHLADLRELIDDMGPPLANLHAVAELVRALSSAHCQMEPEALVIVADALTRLDDDLGRQHAAIWDAAGGKTVQRAVAAN